MSLRRQKFLIKWAAIALTLIALYLLAFVYLIDRRPFVEWTLIKGAAGEVVASSHLIKMPDGKVILLNAGEASGSLLPYLKKQKIKDIDLLILTSLAPRNISGLGEMISTGVRIKEIKVNPQSQKTPEWDVLQSKLLNRGVVIGVLTQGEKLYALTETELNVWVLLQNSLGIQLKHGRNKLLALLGDLPSFESQKLSESCEQFRADILINYIEPQSESQKLKWLDCVHPIADLSREPGTFKILLKGDSFKWKKGR
jgi:beta-lactamase superfamily II metal-dependent hydrolase